MTNLDKYKNYDVVFWWPFFLSFTKLNFREAVKTDITF